MIPERARLRSQPRHPSPEGGQCRQSTSRRQWQWISSAAQECRRRREATPSPPQKVFLETGWRSWLSPIFACTIHLTWICGGHRIFFGREMSLDRRAGLWGLPRRAGMCRFGDHVETLPIRPLAPIFCSGPNLPIEAPRAFGVPMPETSDFTISWDVGREPRAAFLRR